nr:hypothetical protein [Tanacetum cinerariifolium]
TMDTTIEQQVAMDEALVPHAQSFDPIPQTPKNSEDEGDGEEDLGLNIGEEERHVEEEEEDELYRDQSSSVSSQCVTSMLNPTLDVVKVAVQIQSDHLRDEAQRENDEFLKSVDENIKKIIKEHVKEQVKTSYAVAADLSEIELKKILIEKMKGNKSIQRLDKQRNLYKALVEAYKSDKIILDTYGETVTLKRRRDDDADKDEEPSAGPDRGSKRRRERNEPESASAPTETATKSAGKSTQGSRSRQASTGESALAEEPQADSCYSFNELMDTPLDFSNFLINRLKVDTLTLELLACPTYELMKGSCKSLVELEYHLEEVFKATTDQLDWVNPEGQQYPHNLLKPLPLIPNNRGRRVIPFEHFINNDLEYLRGGASSQDLQLGVESYQKKLNLTKPDTYGSDLKHKEAYTAYSNLRGFIYQNKDKKNRLTRIDELNKFSNGTLTDVRAALDDRLKGIRMRYMPQTIWRKSDKDREMAMIQAIDKRLKTSRIMRTLERLVGGRLYKGDFRMLQRTI